MSGQPQDRGSLSDIEVSHVQTNPARRQPQEHGVGGTGDELLSSAEQRMHDDAKEIGRLRARCAQLEQVAEAARNVGRMKPDESWDQLAAALAVLDQHASGQANVTRTEATDAVQ